MNWKPVFSITDNNPSIENEGDAYRVFLCHCKANLQVGIYDKEKQQAQPVLIDVEMIAAPPRIYDDIKDGAIDHVIDYEAVYRFITDELPKLGHVPLLETVAEQIIAFCFRDPRVQKVQVRLEKLEIFSGAGGGIVLCRSRTTSIEVNKK